LNVSEYIYKPHDEKFYNHAYHIPKGYISSLYDPKEGKYIGKLIKQKLAQIANNLKLLEDLIKMSSEYLNSQTMEI